MASNEQLAMSILCSLDIAVLRRQGVKRYEVMGMAPAFYHTFFPLEDSGAPCQSPWKYSPMLEFFLDDAERFFESGQQGHIESGIWQEDGKTDPNSAMLAIAASFGDSQALIIRILHEDFRQQAIILRKARQQLLDARSLSVSLEIFRNKASYDSLTQVLNRGTFMEIVQEKLDIIRKATDKGHPLHDPPSLLMLDIDDFKKVNDTYGHVCGDYVLTAVGKLLQEKLRKSDVAARYGGEEFIIFIARGTPDLALRIAEKVRAAVEKTQYNCAPSITVSVGCATYNINETLENFIKRADEAMYEAKRNGKNQVCAR